MKKLYPNVVIEPFSDVEQPCAFDQPNTEDGRRAWVNFRLQEIMRDYHYGALTTETKYQIMTDVQAFLNGCARHGIIDSRKWEENSEVIVGGGEDLHWKQRLRLDYEDPTRLHVMLPQWLYNWLNNEEV